MNRLLELRNAAMKCSNLDYRAALKAAADQLQWCLDRLYECPTEDSLRSVNSAWAHAHKLLKDVPPEGSPAPLAPSVDAEPMRMVA